MKSIFIITLLLFSILIGCRKFQIKPSVSGSVSIEFLTTPKDSLMVFLKDTLHLSIITDSMIITNSNNWYATFLFATSTQIKKGTILNNSDIFFKSSNDNIAKIKDSIIEAVGPGIVDIDVYDKQGVLLGNAYQLTVYFDTNWAYVPDINFRKALLNLNIPINTNTGYMQTKDARAINGSLNVNNANISSLEGIQYFTNINELNCSNNQITTFTELNALSNLNRLNCSNNELNTIDISNNPLLTIINCNANQLVFLDISNNPELDTIFCANNKLFDLDLQNALKINNLDCSNNNLTILKIAQNVALETLNCSNNLIDGLNILKNIRLNSLICNNNNNINIYLTQLQYNTYVNIANPTFIGATNWVF